MTDVIFILHGIGEHPKDWEKAVVEQMREFCEKFSSNSIPLEKRFTFVGINYSSLYKEILTTWAEGKKGIGDLAEQMGADLVEKLLSWIKDDEGIEKNFLWTHAFDVATYFLLPTVREAVKVHVALQMFEGIKGLPVNSTWSVIAHSLGTAIAHDTLQAWFTQPLAGGMAMGQLSVPRLLQMVANVSRILQTSPKVFDSDVRPGKACEFYFSAHHPLDPFTIIRPFLPTKWPGGPHQEKYQQIMLEPDFIQQANIHDLDHYLRHPDVIIPLMRCLAHKSFVTQQDEANYRKAFNRHGELNDPKLIDLRKKLEDAGVSLPDSWVALLVAWNRIRDVASFAGGANA